MVVGVNQHSTDREVTEYLAAKQSDATRLKFVIEDDHGSFPRNDKLASFCNRYVNHACVLSEHAVYGVHSVCAWLFLCRLEEGPGATDTFMAPTVRTPKDPNHGTALRPACSARILTVFLVYVGRAGGVEADALVVRAHVARHVQQRRPGGEDAARPLRGEAAPPTPPHPHSVVDRHGMYGCAWR